MTKVRLGIIGVGNMGSGHAANILAGKCPEIELTAVADRREARRQWAKDTLPEGTAIFEEGSDLIQSGLCDAVHICTPHYQHPTLAMEAFAAGLHVMCEKPAGVYTKAVREMNEAAEKSGKVFAMMFNQRTNCVYRKMHEMVHSGNQCPHQLDLLQWICGLPKTVQAFCQEGKWHDIEVEDDVTAYLQFANGATGVFVTTTGDAPGTNRFEVTGTLGKLVCENDKLTFWKLAQDEREFCRTATEGFAQPQCQQVEVETDGENLQHVGVLNAFAGKILHGTPLVAEGTEGLGGLTLSNAMHLSSWLGRAVDIPFDEELFLSELNKRRATSRKKESKDITFSTEGTY